MINETKKEIKDDFLFSLWAALSLSCCIIGIIALSVLYILDNYILGGVIQIVVAVPPLLYLAKLFYLEMRQYYKKMKQNE